MKLNLQTTARALNQAWRIIPPEAPEFENFQKKVGQLLGETRAAEAKNESEEHLKNILRDFLRATAFSDFYCNTSGRQDLSIHLGKSVDEPVAVIIEAKKWKKSGNFEMPSLAKPNAKALHELLLYYLRERAGGNLQLKFLVITDLHEWFVFDAQEWERLVFADKKLLKNFNDWKTGQLTDARTELFYREIAQPFFENDCPELTVAHFNLADFETAVEKGDEAGQIDFFKFLHPAHLLRRPFANDSNSLNKPFYDELLFILGLEEVKTDGKKLIQRAVKNRHGGSFFENALNHLLISGKWRKAPDLAAMGENDDDRQFSIALELCITWLNRLLFLKLLEGQLRRWRPDEPFSRFLRTDLIADFDDCWTLFFEVFNQPFDRRSDEVKKRYGHLPYLNSSLFEPTALENATLEISALNDRAEMPLFAATVLKNDAGQRASGLRKTLHYLLDFLEAYDFSSEAGGRVKAANRDLINASVLGLIFEKLNGYRDGSFFTPGFITMFMCRETLRRAVVQKFNDHFGWACDDLLSLANRLDSGKIVENNAVFNTLRVCDPAVGSGHFLVSALNELIAIKSELRILCDREGRRLPWQAEVGNDQLLILNDDDDRPFEYTPGVKAKQRVQETLFFEKQTLIENCLFGVDINPKSVMICRLRLWVELLKNAFFLDGGQSQALETLPNIDINIKTGNSLVSRFALDEDLSEVFKRQKLRPADYLQAVKNYKTTRDRAAKDDIRAFIDRIKSEFRQTVFNRHPFVKKLSETRGLRQALDFVDLFGEQKLSGPDLEKERARLDAEIARLETGVADYYESPLYRNAFEWRFEFPEILDAEGEFVGFDVVVGNPPYGVKFSKTETDFFKSNFLSAEYQVNSFVLFYERGISIVKNNGLLDFITPATIINQDYFKKIRTHFNSLQIKRIRKFNFEVFTDAEIGDSICFLIQKTAFDSNNSVQLELQSNKDGLKEKSILQSELTNGGDAFDLSFSEINFLKTANTKKLGDIALIIVGIKPYQVGKGVPKQTESTVKEKPFSSIEQTDKIFLPVVIGRDFHRYSFLSVRSNFLKYGKWLAEPRESAPFFETKIIVRQTSDSIIAHLDETESINLNNVYNIGRVETENFSLLFILGVLNSKCLNYIYQSIAQEKGRLFAEVKKTYLEKLPIPIPSKEIKAEIEALVASILATKKTTPTADTTQEEAEIDGLVYGLYGLTAAEIALVEGG